MKSSNENKEEKTTKKLPQDSNEIASQESPKEEINQKEMKAKDWGRASNDPRNKN